MVGAQAASLKADLRTQLAREIARYEGLFLRPRRAALAELEAAIDYRGSDPGEAVWARAIAAGRVPADMAEDPERRFRGPGIGPAPRTAYAALLHASDPRGMLEAEANARTLVERLAAWGAPTTRRVVWRIAHCPVAKPLLHGPWRGLIESAFARAHEHVAKVGPKLQIPRHTHNRFEPIYRALDASLRWRAAGEADDPFEPYLAIVRAGYLLHTLRRASNGELTIELAAPTMPPRVIDPHGLDHRRIRAVWSGRLTALRLACVRGDIGTLREDLPLLPADDELGEPRLTHFAVYGGAETLEALATIRPPSADWRLEIDARDQSGRTPLMIAAALPSTGPTGAATYELDSPINLFAGPSACQWLLAAGADPEARDHQGWTAMHWAAARARVHAVEVLLAAGLDPNALDHRGRTPAMVAINDHALDDRADVLGMLMRAGVDMDTRDLHGWTVLHHLAAHSRSAYGRGLARKLVQHGAVPSRDRAGRSPADIAARRKLAADDGGPFDPRTPVAAGPGLHIPPSEPRLIAPMLDELVPLPRDPAELAERADPRVTPPALDHWQVWADWLQSRGEPRGELLARELACVGLGGNKRKRMQAELEILRAKLHAFTHAGLECADALAPVSAPTIEPEWTHGCLTGAVVGRGGWQQPEHLCESVRLLLELEPLLAVLTIACADDHWPKLLERLRSLEPKPQVRRLILAGLPSTLPELDALARVFPRVRSLHLYGHGKLYAGTLRWPGPVHLRTRHSNANEWLQGNVELNIEMPTLTHFDFGLPTSSRTAAPEIEGSARVLQGIGAVQHLRMGPLTQEFAVATLSCSMIDRLRTIELVGVRGAALDTLIHHAERLRKLARVRVSISPVVLQQRPHVIERLRQELPGMELDASGHKRQPFAAWA